MIEALKCVAAGEAGRAQVLREQAFEAAPAVPGEMDGTSFAWIADADTRLGPVLEAVVEGKYLWIPFNRLKAVRVEPPQDLRDVVWMPAYFTWANGGEAAGLVPTRYPGSAESPDPQLRLARRTDWIEAGEDLFLGLGQRMLATDAGERAFMDVREISLTPPVETDDERAASAAEADVP
jgi:type VI secretion system protein ImpE